MPGAEQFDFDVFISYSSRDEAWVRGELLQRIEAADLKAYIDFRDFTPGMPAIKGMERGVVNCRKTLLVLTPNYIHSGWTEIESLTVQTLDPSNRDLRLIPLLKVPCDKPLSLGTLTHIDFTDSADEDLAWRQLLTALGRPPEPEPLEEPGPDQWFVPHPYPMPPNFTGRVAERAMLDRWLVADAAHPVLSLRALGGFGKSALVWHWLTHDVQPDDWPRVVWWSFYEGDASFEHFLADALEYLSGGKIDATKIAAKNAVRTLWDMLHEPGTLLVLDGFERVLRAFGGLDAPYKGDQPEVRGQKLEVRGHESEETDRDCISPLAELFLYHVALQPHLRSKVLITTRLRPRILEARGGGLLQGCREVELEQMYPADAVAFFRARGIRGTDVEIRQACEPYGYHPLSLALLAGWIAEDIRRPGDVAAAKRLDVSGELVQRRHHVLETAYDSLEPSRQALLGRIACFRSPVAYDVLKALAESEANISRNALASGSESVEPSESGASALRLIPSNLDADLRDLVARGLLHHDTREGRFDLHPIVRRYSYDRLAAPDREAAHTRLRDYFAAVPPPDKVTCLEDLSPVIELYHHTVRAGQLYKACTLYRDRLEPLYYQLGAYQLIIDLLRSLFPDGEGRPPRLKNESALAWTLNELANSYSHSGQPRRAVPLFEQVNAICEKQGNKRNLAVGLGNVADAAQLPTGALKAAEANLCHSITLCREIKDEFNEATAHDYLGQLLAHRGAYAESQMEQATALKTFETQKHVPSQLAVWSSHALRELLQLRATTSGGDLESQISDSEAALASARRVLQLADEWARTYYPIERDYVRAHRLLGAAHRVAGQPNQAERHLHEALERCRRINNVENEADILIDLTRLRVATGAADEAQRLTDEALLITERSEYVLQGADAHLELTRLALARGDRAAAREHAEQAHRLATCDGPPDYTYHAAYTEATALLKQLAPQ